MADEDNNHPRDWGHHKSPIFKLPPEIRNKIYHETFAGSERDLVFDPPLDARVVPVTGRRSVLNTAKSTHNFLLTCFQVYSEALAIYWSLTVIGNLRNPSFPRHGRSFSRGYFLNRIPAIARQHVQHLRGVGLSFKSPNRWLQGDAIPRHLSLVECLDFFPNLKSFSFPDRTETFPERTPGEVAASHPHIHSLAKLFSVPPPDAPPLPDIGELGYWSRITFKDLTSGNSLAWYQPISDVIAQWISDEAAFQMVMNTPNLEIRATERRLEFKALNYIDELSVMLEPAMALGPLACIAS